jgi:hypothetical protein
MAVVVLVVAITTNLVCEEVMSELMSVFHKLDIRPAAAHRIVRAYLVPAAAKRDRLGVVGYAVRKKKGYRIYSMNGR